MSDTSQPPPPPSRSGGPPSSGLRRPPTPADVFTTVQTVVALVFGILLFAVPLYLWRRPRPTPAPRLDTPTPDASASASPVAASAPSASPAAPVVRLSDPRILECHDKGAKRTPPEGCDHIAAFEKALGDAIEASHECVPADAGTGSIEYVADLSFNRHRSPVIVLLPKDGRSFQSAKIARDCGAGVRSRLAGFPVASLTHAHSRYKISVVASYDGASAPH